MGSSTLLAEPSFWHVFFYLVRVIRVAEIGVVWLGYVRTYCVPIAALNQNKRSRTLFGRPPNKKAVVSNSSMGLF